jgi:hypothetical protein
VSELPDFELERLNGVGPSWRDVHVKVSGPRATMVGYVYDVKSATFSEYPSDGAFLVWRVSRAVRRVAKRQHRHERRREALS